MISDHLVIKMKPTIVSLRHRLAEYLVVGLLIAGLTIFLQHRLGAYTGEFEADEASHYVSGLVIHDYFAANAPGSPTEFVKRFHSSYPLVGIGHWGPLFYAVEAVWMLLFGWGRAAMMVLPAAITVATATILYAVAMPRFGRLLAVVAAIAFVTSPIIQPGSATLMLDTAIALICLLAALAYSRYLDTGQARYSLAFGLLAAAGLLIKGNAACLALVPAFALVIGRDWRWLRRGSFWLPVPIVLAVAGPWYWLTYALISPGFRYHWGLDYLFVAVPANFQFLLQGLGVLVFAGIVGFLAICRNSGKAGNGMVAMASLLAAVVTFQCVVPAALESRYMAPAVAPLLLLAAFVLHSGTSRPRWSAIRIPVLAIILVLSAAMPWLVDMQAKPQFGITDAVRQVWAHRLPDNPSVLIVMDNTTESATIAELAMNDPARPSLFAVRGSRLLGAGGYNTQDYLPRFQTTQEVIAAIDDYSIPFVLVRSVPGHNPWGHIDQIEAARLSQPDRWELLQESGPTTAPVRLYRIRDNAARQANLVRLEKLSAPKALGQEE